MGQPTDILKNCTPDRIFLVGFMGSGKTFYGKKLAEKLGWGFVDLDEKIEQSAGMTIAEIFENDGHFSFRGLEQAALRETFYFTKTVIATGGGAPCYFENMAEMLENGLIIYLKTPPRLLAARLVGEQNKRPLITKLAENELRDFIKMQLTVRQEIYGKAQMVISQSKNDLAFLDKIMENLRLFNVF